MVNATLSIPLSSGAPAPESALPTAITNGTAPENPFYSALQGLLPGGMGVEPGTGQAVMPAAKKEEETGRDLSADGKDLPPLSLLTTSTNLLNPATDIPAAAIASTAQTPVDPAILANGGALVVPVVSSPAQTASEPANDSVVASDAVEQVLTSQASQPGTRNASIQVSSGPATVKNDTPTDAADAVSPDPLAAITDKIMLAREVTAGLARAATTATAAQPAAREGTSDNQPFMSALADMMPASHGASARSAMHATPINVPFNQPGWDQALGERVRWLVTQRFQAAELHLNPPELGPVEIRLSLNKDQASIQFLSPHASVRDAIETAMPRLREMLGDSGIQLADVNVGQHSAERQAPMHLGSGGSQHASRTFIPEVHGEDEAVVMAATTAISALGLVDYYV